MRETWVIEGHLSLTEAQRQQAAADAIGFDMTLPQKPHWITCGHAHSRDSAVDRVNFCREVWISTTTRFRIRRVV